MKYRLLLPLLLLGLPVLSHADEASHKAAAMKLIAKINSKETMMSGFTAMIEPMFKQLASQGIPAEGIKEVRQAMTDWFTKEVDFTVIAPKLADLYTQEFSEEELSQIVAFYDTPLGTKLLGKLPVLMQKGAAVSQEQLQTKQADLQKKIMEILSKYAPNAGGAPGAK